MELEITSKEQKPLLKRTEVGARIAYQGVTPTRKEIVAGIAKALKADKSLVIVRKIDTAYGEQTAKITAFLYETKEALATLEHEYVKKKHLFGEEKAVEEAKAEEKPAETPAEAPKEEATKEKKEETPAEKPAEKAKAEEKKTEEPKTKEKPAEAAEEKKEGDA